MSAYVRALACWAAITAWSWKAPGRPAPSASREEAVGLGDHRCVPPGPVLVLEQHQVAGAVDPGREPGALVELEREQAADLTRLGEQRPDQPGQPDRLVGEVDPEQPGVARLR